MLFLLCKEIIL